MTVTPIDLSALDAFNDLGAGRGSGKPLLLDLEIVHEDPNQPRKEFDDILEMAASVGEVGVKVPITVRPHPVMDGHYMVKFGARRRRAALAAGLSQIPAWIDDVPSDFEQVIENLQRKDLTAMELAQFMAEKQNAGMKQAVIARKLGIAQSAVAKHLALVNAPPDIEAVYRSGRSTSPDTLFDLRAVYTRYPTETKAWLDTDVDISRRSVEELKRSLGRDATSDADAQVPNGAQPSSSRISPQSDPSKIKRPVVAVKVAERLGIIVLNRRAVTDDHLLIKWDDTADVEEVPCRDVLVVRLDDARRYEPINRGLNAGPDPTTFPPDERSSPT